MSGTRVVCLSFILSAFGLIACSDVYGPPDTELEIDTHLSADAEGNTIERGIAWFHRSGFVVPVSLFAFRRVEPAESRVEPVPSFLRGSEKTQALPGILVEMFFDYVILRDCSQFGSVEGYAGTGPTDEYWEVYQVGTNQDACTINLPADDLAGQTADGERPACLLMGRNKASDNGRPFVARTGPNGTIRLHLRFVDPDESTTFDAMFYKFTAFAGGASATIQSPSDASKLCAEGGAAAAPYRSVFQ